MAYFGMEFYIHYRIDTSTDRDQKQLDERVKKQQKFERTSENFYFEIKTLFFIKNSGN